MNAKALGEARVSHRDRCNSRRRSGKSRRAQLWEAGGCIRALWHEQTWTEYHEMSMKGGMRQVKIFGYRFVNRWRFSLLQYLCIARMEGNEVICDVSGRSCCADMGASRAKGDENASYMTNLVFTNPTGRRAKEVKPYLQRAIKKQMASVLLVWRIACWLSRSKTYLPSIRQQLICSYF